MYKFFAALPTVESAHQKALSTRKAWLGEKVHGTEAPRAHPWNIFQRRDIPSEPATSPPRSRLLDDLAELAEGMGKPERTPPRFGPIASPDSGSAKRRTSQRLSDPPSPTPGAGYVHTEIVAPVPTTPIPLLYRPFEVRESTTTLSAPLSAFYDSFDENRPESPDGSCPDENIPPSRLLTFGQEQESTDVVIPQPKLRGRREPFAVLHFDIEGAPSEDGGGENPIVEADDDLADARGNFEVVGVLCEDANVASGYCFKGWDRLRSKAPGALSITAVDASRKEGFPELDHEANHTHNNPLGPSAEKSKAPTTPKITSVPLPSEITLSCVSLSLIDNNLEDITTLVAQKKFSPQMTPCRLSLLTILNEGPNHSDPRPPE